MSITYVKEKTVFGDEIIVRTGENGIISFIPTDPANSDYQRYLNPEAAQSTPIVTEDE
jgi:hypothetical protein